ncbi:hypothetical protein GDO86_009721 [Hymenochirus boettgeri]|uniref:Uncharacterized protein n=1 Tax=Hymenochirus boettgeri TaxID=247094 RepID=A0A8T2JK46_9PIPI|nr:hypothetical protein GDO86_009721 [Hymenochirus boettgeri]
MNSQLGYLAVLCKHLPNVTWYDKIKTTLKRMFTRISTNLSISILSLLPCISEKNTTNSPDSSTFCAASRY